MINKGPSNQVALGLLGGVTVVGCNPSNDKEDPTSAEHSDQQLEVIRLGDATTRKLANGAAARSSEDLKSGITNLRLWLSETIEL